MPQVLQDLIFFSIGRVHFTQTINYQELFLLQYMLASLLQSPMPMQHSSFQKQVKMKKIQPIIFHF